MNQGIYQILCTGNGKMYVGSSIDIEYRWKQHRNFLKAGNHVNKPMQNSYNKYGKDSFIFSIIQPVFNIENLYEIEEGWIAKKESSNLEVGFNLVAICGPRQNTGMKHSEETRAKISAAIKGKKQGELNGFFGKRHTKDSIEKMRETKLSLALEDKYRVAAGLPILRASSHKESGLKSWQTKLKNGTDKRNPESTRKAMQTKEALGVCQGRPVVAVDYKGDIVAEFKNGRAARSAGYTQAQSCAKYGRISQGLRWYYKDELNVN